MPSAPTSKLFIPKELTSGSLVFVKYLAQIGNRREKLGKRNEFIPSARIRGWPDQAGSSRAQTPERITMTPGGMD